MKFLVLGLGSMGKRRIKLLKESFNIRSIAGVDLSEERRENTGAEFDIKTYSDIDEAVRDDDFDNAFVCTSPLSHFKIIDKCLDHKMDVFSEINLVSDGYAVLIKKAKENNRKLFLSSTPMYRKELAYITEKVKESRKNLNYIYHVGQYLPDWHPWERYSDFFIGDKRTNGCREIFAIELPWLIDAFSEVENVCTVKSKNTGLDIEYDDNYIVVMTHRNGHKGVLCVDVVSRKAVRNFETYGEDLHMQWGGTPETLFEFNFENREYEKRGICTANNMYVDEMTDYFNYIQGRSVPLYSFEKDLITLKIIDRIESENQ